MRPKANLVNQVTSKSTDFASQDLLVQEMKNNPFSFHHLTKAHLNFTGAYQEPEKFLPFAANFIERLIREGSMKRDENDSYYLYEQRIGTDTFKGIIGLCAVADYKKDAIKKHEQIRATRTKYLMDLFRVTHVIGEPVVLSFHGENFVHQLDGDVLYDFESIDGKRHILSQISNQKSLAIIRNQIEVMDALYIADGHHRTATAARYHDEHPQANNSHFLSLLIHEDELTIKPFNRLIKPYDSIKEQYILTELEKDFIVETKEEPVFEIKESRTFGLYLSKRWYKLIFNRPSDLLDVEILEKYIVKRIFRIKDSRVDARISFLSSETGIESFTDLIDSRTYEAGLTLKPCDFSEIRTIADKGETMPPKSTYIEPKLRAGLVVQEIR